MKWRLACALLAVLPAAAVAEIEGRIAQLVAWQEDPLDLRDASAHELILLPGIDSELAASILRLRELGELQSVHDLVRVPGLAPSVIEAMIPYVHTGEAAGTGYARWEITTQHRTGSDSRMVHRLRAGGRRLEATAVLVDDDLPRWRGAFGVDLGSWRVFAGHLRVGGASGIFGPVSGRSRLAPAARPRSSKVRFRTDSSAEAGWSTLALSHPRGHLFTARDARARTIAGAGLDLTGERIDLHVGLRVDEVGWAASLDAVRGTVGWVGLTLDGDARSARAGMRFAGSYWRAGLDASTTDGALRIGSDPVSGHRLDRDHDVVQVFGRVRGGGWSVGALWRDLARGGAARVSTTQFEAAWRGPPVSVLEEVSLRIRAAPDPRLTLTARQPVAYGEWRFRFAREASGSELFGTEYRLRTQRQEVRVTAVGVDGTASHPWMLSRPGTGIYPVWMRPPGGLVAMGWGLRAERARLGAWIWLRADAGRAPGPGFGLFCSLEPVGMVRRLQGSAASGTGAPSRRSPGARLRRRRP
jgi:hypothetical protein